MYEWTMKPTNIDINHSTLHDTCIQTVKKTPIFNIVYHLGDLKKDKLNLEYIWSIEFSCGQK